MEGIVLEETVKYLLKYSFRSKKEMACKIGVSYRALLNCCAGKGTHRAINDVFAKLIRYCIKNRIMLDEAINLPA